MPRSPLSPSMFLIRNLGKTIPLVAVIMLAVMLVQTIIALINSIPLSIRTVYKYSEVFLGVSPRGDTQNTPRLVKLVSETSPVPIDRVVICRASGAQIQSIVGKLPFVVLGLSPEDTKYYLGKLQVSGLDGRIPDPGQPEALISQPIAKNLGLKLGSVLQSPKSEVSYSPMDVKVVGIAKSEQWFMVNNIDYQKVNHFPPVDLALIFAKNLADQEILDKHGDEVLKGQRAQVYAYHLVRKESDTMFQTLYVILNAVISILVLVITVMMAMLMNIYQAQRIVEFGLLQAIGFTKQAILKRVLVEAVIFIVIGWAIGLLAAQAALRGLKAQLMDPKAFALDTGDFISFLYTVPIPIVIMIVAVVSIALRFKRFDPVSVVERRVV